MPLGNGFVSEHPGHGVKPPSKLATKVVVAVNPRVPNVFSRRRRKLRRRPEQPVAAAQHRFFVQRPGDAAPWRELEMRRVALMGAVAVDARIHQAALQIESRNCTGNGRSRSKPTVKRFSRSLSPCSNS